MKKRLTLIDFMASIQIRFYTWRHGEYVGTDRFGNKYYQERSIRDGWRQRRWCLFADSVEASNTPPEWFGWLHYTLPKPLDESNSPYHKPWQQEYVPNLTGTKLAYLPPGHELEGGHRPKATGDYQAWTPE